MMKKKFLTTVSICFCCLSFLCLHGCAHNDHGGSAAITNNLNLNDYDLLTDEFLRPLADSGMTSYSWSNVKNIHPDEFVEFYESKIISQIGNDKIVWDANPFRGDLVEKLVQRYFDVDLNQIRNARFYNADNHTYTVGSLGGAASYKVVHAELSECQLSLDYEYYSAADDATVIRNGNIKILLTPGSYKYISCSTHSIKL